MEFGQQLFFYMPRSWDMGQIILLPLRRKACCGFFQQASGFDRERTRDLGYQRPACELLDHRSRWIRTHDRNRRASVDLRLRPRGHLDRLIKLQLRYNSVRTAPHTYSTYMPTVCVTSRAANRAVIRYVRSTCVQ
jgi:hypothetical protein